MKANRILLAVTMALVLLSVAGKSPSNHVKSALEV